jgi:hypothetical protein
MESEEQHEPSPEAYSTSDTSASSSLSEESPQELLETPHLAEIEKQREKLFETLRLARIVHEKGQEAIEKAKLFDNLQTEIDEMIADPRSNLSPFLAGEFTSLLELIGDSKASERDVRAAEFKAQMLLAFHTSWKARQMDDHNAARADEVAHNLTNATRMLAAATIAVVLATVGLIIATIIHH